jgi:hypothetical protein
VPEFAGSIRSTMEILELHGDSPRGIQRDDDDVIPEVLERNRVVEETQIVFRRVRPYRPTGIEANGRIVTLSNPVEQQAVNP